MADIQAKPKIVRLRVNLNQETADALLEMVGPDNKPNATEVVRRAIAVYHFFWKMKQEGKKHVTFGTRQELRRNKARRFVLVD
jgi:hypothetical protein